MEDDVSAELITADVESREAPAPDDDDLEGDRLRLISVELPLGIDATLVTLDDMLEVRPPDLYG